MKLVCLALVLLACSQAVAGQTYTSTLFQTFNATSGKTGFSSCNETQPAALATAPATIAAGQPLTALTVAEAADVIVDAVWFGGAIGPASNFQIVNNCSVLQLTSNGGHGTTIYTGPVPEYPDGCTISYFSSTNYLTVFVNITNTGFDWSVSLPTVTTVRAQTSCNGGYEYCPLAIAVPCSSVLSAPTTLNPDGTMPVATQG